MLRLGACERELPKLELRVLGGGMEGACARRDGCPEAVSKPWKGWDEKKGVFSPLVTVS